MKKLLLSGCFLMIGAAPVFAQTYMTRTGKITFDATTPKSPEKIAAVNNEVASVLNGKTGDFVFQAPVKSFKFKDDLMEKHFNENYMETDKFPKAEFKGKITNFADVNMAKDGTYNVTVAGKLTIHGVTQEVSVPGTVTVKGKDMTAKAKFEAVLEKYGIKIPGVVADKIAKEATINIDAILTVK